LHSMILIQHAKHASFQRWYQIPPFDDLIQRAKHERQFAKSRRVLESLLFLLTKKTSDPGYLQYK
jgi:hypothetical protein